MKKITVILMAAILALTLAAPPVIAGGKSAADETDVLTNTTDEQEEGMNNEGIINPEITWNTFLGGNGWSYGSGIAVDGSGNIYITGESYDTWGSPVRDYSGDDRDAFVAKLDSEGNFIWNTFLGGSDEDMGNDIAVDGSGNIYVTGYSTATWGSPVRAYTSGYGDEYTNLDAFVAKLDSSGNLTWNTFLGDDGEDMGNDIAVDGSGNTYVTGYSTTTWGLPVRAYTSEAVYYPDDAFVAKIDSSGNLTWNTFLGGESYDRGYGITVDGSGNIYVTGESSGSWGSPIQAYTYGDAFVARLDGSGNIIWNAFLGGNEYNVGHGIAVDGNGNVYVTGESWGTWGSPVRAYTSDYDDAYTNRDVFVVMLDGNGNLTWNTFLGSGDDDMGNGIAIDSSGNVYVSGTSNVTWGSPIRAYTDYLCQEDAFVAMLDSSGNLTWNTFLGGRDPDNGYGIAVDGSGNVYVTGVSWGTWGSPVRDYMSHYDAFVTKLSNAVSNEPDNGIDLWVWFAAGGGFILLVITGTLLKRRMAQKKT